MSLWTGQWCQKRRVVELIIGWVESAHLAVGEIDESVETTQIYLHADMQLKEKALGHADPSGVAPARFQPQDRLLEFLKSL